jgi:hypothetical protein
MIMDQHDKTGFRESPRKSFHAVLLHTGIAVRDRNRRGGTFGAGNEQPPRDVTPPSTPNSIFLLSAIAICFSPYAHVSSTRSACELYREKYPSERTALDEVPECLCSLCETSLATAP